MFFVGTPSSRLQVGVVESLSQAANVLLHSPRLPSAVKEWCESESFDAPRRGVSCGALYDK